MAKLQKKFRLNRRLHLDSIVSQLGPGLITGAADDDPSGIGTYSIAGAQFGFTFLWTAPFTWPLMACVQYACAQVGMVTGEGLTRSLERKIPRWAVAAICFSLLIANTLNVGADLSAMADSAEMLGLGSSHLWVVVFGVIISWATVQLRYQQIVKALKWLVLALFAYVATAFLTSPDWSEALRRTFIPTALKTKDEWGVVVAILGTTISPYLFFWQTAIEVEESKSPLTSSLGKRLWIRALDVTMGTFFSNFVMFFVILTTAMTLHRAGLTQIETSKQAAMALEPLAGHFSYLLYTIGMIGVGVLAIPTLTSSAAYAMAELFKWDSGLDSTLKEARAFYTVILISTGFAVIFDFLDFSAIKALYWSAVLNGLIAPFILAGLLLIITDNTLMKGQRPSLLLRGVLGLTIVLMAGAAVGMFWFS